MPVRRLAHFSIRTSNLEQSKRFYVEVLGFKLGYRPPLDFPGAWLYAGDDEADFGVVHLIGMDEGGKGLTAYLGERNVDGDGTGALDHLAFLANDVEEFRQRLAKQEVVYRERTLPGLGLRQLFFVDPSGLTIEMNFPALEASNKKASSEALQMVASMDARRADE